VTGGPTGVPYGRGRVRPSAIFVLVNDTRPVDTRQKEPTMSAITSSRDHLASIATRAAHPLLVLAYATGAAALAGEGAVHVQEYVTLMHLVPWVGPLFLANAAACAATILGLAFRPTRQLASLGGVVVSALALGGLVLSYGRGLLGWHEVAFRTSIAVAVITAVSATIALTLALAVAAVRPGGTAGRSALSG